MIPPAATLLGLVIGSFLNVVIERVPGRNTPVRSAVRCPECEESISPKDTVPLVSYLWVRGRCRGCGGRIPSRYLVVEALVGLLFGVAAYRFGASVELVSALVLICALVSLAFIDLEHRLLPNVIVGPASVAGLLLSVMGDPAGWWVYPLCAVAVAGGLFALAIFYPGGMGMGDVKMGGMLGAFLGPYGALAVFLGALFGAVAGGLMLAFGRMGRGSALPFGTFMALGGVVALFAGPGLVGSYLRLVAGA